ncbi:hypothetical protein H0H81_009839 [Sphagnurus paluster]|uniref:Uncharacterized protein n=1 Tax=Sphagnurus paluster TaxID=117069 RepID=A0A9P7GM99_9AGAR|nr:hypothetical protein H0H81_009839 [Sphagnurus paluster]
MAWKPTSKIRAIVQTKSPKCRFEVEFLGLCSEFFQAMELKARDEFLLSLKGVRVMKLERSSASCDMPMKLIYEKGAVIKFLRRRGGPCETVDTWKLKQLAQAVEDSWFNTPRECDASAIRSKQIPAAATTKETNSESRPLQDISASATVVTRTDNTYLNPGIPTPLATTSHLQILASDPNAITEVPEVRMSKKKRRQMIKASKQQAGSVAKLPVVPADTDSKPLVPSTDGDSTSSGVLHWASIDPLSNKAIIEKEQCTTPLPSPVFTAGLSTTNLGDPSNTDMNDFSGDGSFQINCFTDRYKQWLPQPELGEIMIMRDVKGSLIGVGFKDRLKWAIYSPATGKIRHNELGDAPASEGLDNGVGYIYSPFYRAESDEAVIRYCVRMADWWLDVQKQRKNKGDVHQVGVIRPVRGTHRKHLMISEAGPGFFDCTAEVRYNYTLNAQIMPVQGQWCSPGLSDYAFRIEAWGEAADFAQTMFVGEYYSMRNVRMKITGGYLEGRLNDKSCRKLEIEEATDNEYLKLLLE